MKKVVFDAGPIISLATNNLLWVLEKLKETSKVEFLIPKRVKEELVDKPFATKRFKFEALQVLGLIEKGVITVVDDRKTVETSNQLLDLANNSFNAHNKNISLVHSGEIETLALALNYNAEAVVIDEMVTRDIIESPKSIEKRMSKRLHTRVSVNLKNLKRFRDMTKPLNIIRSVELLIIAYEKGLLNKFILHIEQPRKQLLQSVLWGLKVRGCAITRDEIDAIVKIEKGKKT